MMKQGSKRQRKKRDDSDDSDWSQIDKPGQSRIDKLIRQRNRFSMHFHKQDFISIPQQNRLPLLPNQEIYDWQEQRRLLIINKEFNLRQPVPQKKPREYIEQVLSEKDEVDSLVNNQWVNISKEEINNRLRTQSMRLLEGAAKQSDFQLSKLDNIQLPEISEQDAAYNKKFNMNQSRYLDHDDKIKRKRGRPRKKPIKQHIPDQALYKYITNNIPQAQIQRTSQLRKPPSAAATPLSSKQPEHSKLIIAPSNSEDEESLDISLDIHDDIEESYFNTRKS